MVLEIVDNFIQTDFEDFLASSLEFLLQYYPATPVSVLPAVLDIEKIPPNFAFLTLALD
jgi:hypothetical protein